jgi:hypothetical protein
MNNDEYFDLLDLGTPIRDRLNKVLHFYSDILPHAISQVFVSETAEKGGGLLVGSLWVFAGGFVCEAHEVLTQDKFDIATAGYQHVIVEARSFELGAEPTEKSRLLVKYSSNFRSTGNLRASGANCQVLYDLYKTHFVRNVAQP